MTEKTIKNNESQTGERILLALLPFWDPQIPPLGIACLKSYLQQHGYNVKAVDVALQMEYRDLHDEYFKTLEGAIPRGKRGNILNIGNQVLRNHLTAYLNKTDEARYRELVRILIRKTFFTEVEDQRLQRLEIVIENFYATFKTDFMKLLEREKPTVLGFTVYGDTLPASLYAFRLAKKWNPSIKNVIGGGVFADQLAPGSPQLEYFVERTEKIIDKIVIGEGEEIFLEYLRGNLDNSTKVQMHSDIGSTGLDLSKAAVPDFTDFDIGYYPHLAHYGARSCPFQCKFCSETINWGRYRKKDVHQIVAEYIRQYETYKTQLYLMTDSTLNPIINDLSKAVIESGKSIYWDGFLRADKHVCNTENTLQWRRGGFYRAKLGLESGSQRVLDLMDKRISIEQSRAALAALAYAGIKTTTFWLFGFPGETEEDFLQTLEFIEETKDYIYEADCNAFNYYLTGQPNSDEWQKNNKGVRLYPGWAKEMLVTETYILEGVPSREEAYDRVNRFVKHLKKLGIPNPYSLEEVNKADERWKNLHKNAVPSVLELKDRDTYIDETGSVQDLVTAAHRDIENEDFDF